MTIKKLYELHRISYLRSYKKIYEYFSGKPSRTVVLKFVGKASTIIVYAAYAVLLVMLALRTDFLRLTAVATVSFAAFAAVTVIRSRINAPRPYEFENVKALVPKSTRGRSCPSRHSACAFIIALSWLYSSIPAGAVMLLIAIIIAAVRPLMGVHFPLDTILGALLSLAIGLIGFYAVIPLVTARLSL